MKCRECGARKFSIGSDSSKYCKNCGTVHAAVWNKTDRFSGGA